MFTRKAQNLLSAEQALGPDGDDEPSAGQGP
jgi:hypothetical protein